MFARPLAVRLPHPSARFHTGAPLEIHPELPIPSARTGRSHPRGNRNLSDNTPDSPGSDAGETVSKRVRKPRAAKATDTGASTGNESTHTPAPAAPPAPAPTPAAARSEERRVGNECVSTC